MNGDNHGRVIEGCVDDRWRRESRREEEVYGERSGYRWKGEGGVRGRDGSVYGEARDYRWKEAGMQIVVVVVWREEVSTKRGERGVAHLRYSEFSEAVPRSVSFRELFRPKYIITLQPTYTLVFNTRDQFM